MIRGCLNFKRSLIVLDVFVSSRYICISFRYSNRQKEGFPLLNCTNACPSHQAICYCFAQSSPAEAGSYQKLRFSIVAAALTFVATQSSKATFLLNYFRSDVYLRCILRKCHNLVHNKEHFLGINSLC